MRHACAGIFSAGRAPWHLPLGGNIHGFMRKRVDDGVDRVGPKVAPGSP